MNRVQIRTMNSLHKFATAVRRLIFDRELEGLEASKFNEEFVDLTKAYYETLEQEIGEINKDLNQS